MDLQLTDLRADCANCTALCCVLLPYSRAAGFGADKPGGVPCAHLAEDDRCRIHASLRPDGWPSCDVFDCFGAGQWVSGHTYAGRGWRAPGTDRGEMAAVLSAQRLVHEMLWHLDEVVRRNRADDTTRQLQARLVEVRGMAPVELLTADLDEILDDAGAHFAEITGSGAADLRGRDLAGRDLRREAVSGASFRGALLIGADLRGVDLGHADLLGADLRGARLEGADLGDVWFLTRPQLTAAGTDGRTVVPPRLR